MSFYGYRVNWVIDEQPHDVAVLYKFDNGGYEKALDETIDDLTRRRIPPDRILIVCPKGSESGVRREFELINQATKERLRSITHVALGYFDYVGKIPLSQICQLKKSTEDWILDDDDIANIVEWGMRDIVSSTGTRMVAPPGYVFRKPSGNTHSVFIRAGNMVRDPAALAVLFHAMVRKIPSKAKRIYIDSSTILSIVLNYRSSMVNLARECGVEYESPTITNFHSYLMEPNLKFEGSEDYVILISATSSGGLMEKLITERHAQRDKSFHLLAFSSKENLLKSAIFFEPEIDDEDKLAPTFRKIISIPGEEFLASHGETRTVDITKSHLVSRERIIYKDIFYQHALRLNLSEGNGYGNAYRPIGFQNIDVLGTKIFKEWIGRQTQVELPRNICVVVSIEDERSEKLADYVVSLISEFQKNLIHQVRASQLEDLLRIQEGLDLGTVLIVASEEGNGESLLSISQILREKPKLHRHYLIGHLFPASAKQFRRLRSNLQTSGAPRKYGLSVYCTTPVGDAALYQPWVAERNFNYGVIRLHNDFKELAKSIQIRARVLKQLSLSGNSLFMPKINGECLLLRDDSVLFEEGHGEISQITIYVQIAAALQRARDQHLIDDRTLPEKICFQNNPFVDTVIDPDTFSRFNDGVIQSAILRAASHSELNYSRDEKLSRHMLSIFSDIVMSRHRPRGEAVLEFMLAAFVMKLRFNEKHYDEVQELIQEIPELTAVWNSFLEEPPF